MIRSLRQFGDFTRGFFAQEQAVGIILILCTAFSLVLANSPFQKEYLQIWEYRIGYESELIQLKKTALHWINDGLMTFFFLLVGLEIKREIVKGELSTFKKSFFPLAAAFGGMVVPASIFLVLNASTQYASGWGIPMATDIAFALGVLSFAAKYAPPSMRVFLTAFAIIDDLGAVLVIAVAYTADLLLDKLLYAGIILAVLSVLGRLKLWRPSFYAIGGAALWYLLLKSGVHATIAGVLLAFTIPISSRGGGTPVERLEHLLRSPVSYVVMPLFALANTAIVIDPNMFLSLTSTLSVGIIFGLLVGKPVGILAFSYLSTKVGFAHLPSKAEWNHIGGIGFLGGIGFTMSIFISLLAFRQSELQNAAKVAILAASISAGLVGFAVLKLSARRSR